MNLTPPVSPEPPSPQAIKAALKRVLSSTDFDKSSRSKGFLRFVVERTLEGRSNEISQEAIAAEVLGRKGSFDAASDPIVRMQAGRVRRSLEHYYLTEGRQDSIILEIPKGTYIPCFRINAEEITPYPEKAKPQTEGTNWPGILVAPFRNLTGKSSYDYLSYGLASDLATELSFYREVRVFLSKGEGDERNIHAQAEFELRGSLQPCDRGLRLCIQFLDRVSGELFWGKNHDLDAGSIRLDDLIQGVAALIAEEKGLISQQLMTESPPSRSDTPATYDALLAYYHLDMDYQPERILGVLEGLEEAVKREPNNGPCWSALARLYGDIIGHEIGGTRATLELALACAYKGKALLPKNPKSRIILGYVLLIDGQVAQAKSEAEAAYALNPDSLFFLDAIGYLLTLCGDRELGPELSKQAIQQNPFHREAAHSGLWLDAVRRENWEEALAEAHLFNTPYSYWGPLMRIVAMVHGGLSGHIEAERAHLLKIKPDFKKDAPRLVRYYVKSEEVEQKILSAVATAFK